uniref:Uncharacterized protein n=1 Tax=Arundo donax TaxID=35708 RepID=A0A0A9EBZ1_ARUDO
MASSKQTGSRTPFKDLTNNTSMNAGNISNKENMAPDENTDWLHKNDTYQRQNVSVPCQDQGSIMISTEETSSPVQLPGLTNNGLL